LNSKPNPTLEQQRAAFAWRQVTERSGKPGFPDYRNLAKAAPALVAANGLLTALLFFESKRSNGEAAKWLLADLDKWLGQRGVPARRRTPDVASLQEALTAATPAEYREATDEVLQVLRWIRQFAAASGGSSDASQRS
jgi:CRISPR type III-B/RAMP module-associated protein Cmr5